MAKYTQETSRNKKLHLMDVGEGMYLDFTKRAVDAIKADKRGGYANGGPNLGQEMQKAQDYAVYVGKYAAPDTLHLFFCNDYFLFHEKGKAA